VEQGSGDASGTGIQGRLGLPSAVALVVANTIGTGVFTTSGFALADLGRPSIVLLAWAVGGLIALCGAISYGALARRFPESGGEYLFLSRIVHPAAGFLAGWVSLLAGFTAPIAAAGLGLHAYLAAAVDVPLRPEWVGTAAIGAAALMHGLRLRQGVVLQNVAVAVKIAVIAAVVVFGWLRLPEATPPAASVDFEVGAFAVTLVWISFSYSGWNAAVYIAEDLRDPTRMLPRSLVSATLCVTAVYLGLNAVFVYAAPVDQLAGKADVGAVAFEAMGGPPARRAISVLVSLALFTSISSMVMAGPRVYAKMAADGLFPRVFRAGGDVPAAAVMLQAGLALVVVWVSGLAELLGYIGFTLGLSAAATVSALFWVRMRDGSRRVPVPGFPWTPGLFVLATLATAGFMIVREPVQAGLGLATILAAVPLYAVTRGLTPAGGDR
jgi:APA family basic amino acid/polyamine antiporter